LAIFRLGPSLTRSRSSSIAFDILQSEVKEAIFKGTILSENALYAMGFTYSRQTGYFNDFDIHWNSERQIEGKLVPFNERFEDAYGVVKDVIDKIPLTEDGKVKVELYARTEDGINRNLPITEKPIDPDTGNPMNIPGIETDYKKKEFNIDLKNPSEAIVSMLLWMMVEPNIFSVVKWGSGNLLYLDIYGIYDQSHIDSGLVQPGDRIRGSLVWGNKPDFTIADFNDFKLKFDKLFQYGDILHFLGFHNHEMDPNTDNIIDYIKDKVLEFFRLRKPSNFDRSSEIIELR